MVYESLSISSKQLRLLVGSGICIGQQVTDISDNQSAIHVTLHTLPVQILSTCQLVHFEALPFLSRKLDDVRETLPKLTIDIDCLYTSALKVTQDLLCAVLNDLNNHPFINVQQIPFPSLKDAKSRPQYPNEVKQWLAQTTHLLLSQRPKPCPFSGFMGMRTYPTVRIIIEVSKVWRHQMESRSVTGTASVTSRLSQVWSVLADHTKKLRHVKGGAIVFSQEDQSVMASGGLVKTKTVALDFGICRVVE